MEPHPGVFVSTDSPAHKNEGCTVLDKTDDPDYGTFARIIDPVGNKVALWQPLADQ